MPARIVPTNSASTSPTASRWPAGRDQLGPASLEVAPIRVNGRDYHATNPELISRAGARDLINSTFSPLERVGFRLLGIRQFMRLHAAPRPGFPPLRSPPGAAADFSS